MSQNKKSRVIVGLAGPTGSGKSVIAALFKEIAGQIQLPFRFATAGIDAFHFTNDYLLSQKTNEGTLKNHKGRFDTYDVAKLVSALEYFSAGENVALPEYSRKKHDPIENVLEIHEEKALLLVEGLWLLYDTAGWEKVGQYLDFALFVDVDKNIARETVTNRHIMGGRTAEDAFYYYDAVDAKNFDLVMNTKNKADKIIAPYYKIS